VKPIIPKKFKRAGRPSKKKQKPESLSNEKYEELMRSQNRELLAAIQEETDAEREQLARSAPYKRAKILAAIVEAIATLKPHSIQTAWRTTHLYPFFGTPNYSRKKELRLLNQIPEPERKKLLDKMREAEEQDNAIEAAERASNATEKEATKEATVTTTTTATAKITKGRKRGRPRKEKAKNSDQQSETENAQGNANIETMKPKRKKRGHYLFKGVLSNSNGYAWLEDYERRPEKYQTTPAAGKFLRIRSLKVRER